MLALLLNITTTELLVSFRFSRSLTPNPLPHNHLFESDMHLHASIISHHLTLTLPFRVFSRWFEIVLRPFRLLN
jgi:hypothetical protein